MTSKELRLSLRNSARKYASKRNIPIDESYKSTVLYRNLEDNFISESFYAIKQNSDWYARLDKRHQNVDGALEMQSSNSSDALLMNVFCYPQIEQWKGIRDILGVPKINPVFGFKAEVSKRGGKPDSTEIDMVICDLFIEAKLTESNFTKKYSSIVDQYDDFAKRFHIEMLPKHGKYYDNYQIIRNLLAAIQHDRRHALICDERRTDLIKSYMETVSCLRESTNRKRCFVISWQEIRSACGAVLKGFLLEKYGL